MRKSQTTLLLSAALVFLMVLLVFTSLQAIRITSGIDLSAEEPPQTEATAPKKPEAVKTGLLEEEGSLYFYTEDGTPFTGGYLELQEGQNTYAYYFLPNGQAYTSGYKAVQLDGTTHYFFFEEDGKAFTGGFRDIPFGDGVCTYYFGADGKALTSGWETIQDNRYYFQDNGRVAKDGFFTLEDTRYYFDQDGTLFTDGWFCIEEDEAYYYADSTGVLVSDTVVEGYQLDKDGKSSTKYRINQYVAEHTDPSMTNEEKIQALYDWVLRSDMRYIRTYEHVRSGWRWKDSWVDDMATSHMNNWGGNCFRYAAFMGMLLREATGLPVRVYHGSTYTSRGTLTPHSWCAVLQDEQWYIYDVELQKFTAYSRANCFHIPANQSYTHVNGVGTDLYS